MIGKSFKILLAIWNFYPDLIFEHWDVKTAFVNAPLKETVYCRQVPGFEKPGTERKILLLKKALYGTKQAANAWQHFFRPVNFAGERDVERMNVCTFFGRGAFLLFYTCR